MLFRYIRYFLLPFISAGLLLQACSSTTPGSQRDDGPIHLSILGSNDVHGQLLPAAYRGGLVTFSGYVDALRASGASDAVLLVDAGDMWQGTLESNIDEGQPVVEAFNAMGYAAAAIGNHEFDFGPIGAAAIPDDDNPDPRGALRRNASAANFPLLAANLVTSTSGIPVVWDNVLPSVIVPVGNLEVGIIGVMTANALRTTIAANVVGLEVRPLAASIRREATKLRAEDVDLVIVLAHAGSRCHAFDDPNDLSTCEMGGEIMQVANALPPGLVDHIVAGHVHDGIAHIVNGISITSSYSSTRAFSRVDFEFDPVTHKVLGRHVFAPQPLCPYRLNDTGECAFDAIPGVTVPARYESRPVVANPKVVAIADRARQRAEALKNERPGAWLEVPFTLEGNPESALSNLFTDALLEEIDADIAIHNVSGGIRAYLPAGALTFGAVYEMFPFDNGVMLLNLSGRELREVIAGQASRGRRRAGFSGMRVQVACDSNGMQVTMTLDNGHVIKDDDTVRVIANDFLALGGDDILTPAMPAGGFPMDNIGPRTRDVLYDWFRKQGRLRPEDFATGNRAKWTLPAEIPPACSLKEIN
ncbi:MAG TPA: bifunctional UDP-sugar hydrolase/5'-nucleotidase [Woeseiaceae bacterium]|nr:bifunctional UDP-sugar hydrolase/5'-nucleotidase [Woeseiaceae bacterium]